jgi:transcriptional regulator with XRE-family HTH domain
MKDVNVYKQQVIEKIGINIRAVRKARDITQEKLAEQANVAEKHLSAIENGRTKNISIAYLINIAVVLDIDYRELLHD